MADRIQHRRDTAERWATFNPILLEGEIGYVLDNPNQHKIGDGVHAWNDLPMRGFTGNISQEEGNDENAVMSQKATTEKLSELGSKVEFEGSEDSLQLVGTSYAMITSNGYLVYDKTSVDAGMRIRYAEVSKNSVIKVNLKNTAGFKHTFYASMYDSIPENGGTVQKISNAKLIEKSLEIDEQYEFTYQCQSNGFFAMSGYNLDGSGIIVSASVKSVTELKDLVGENTKNLNLLTESINGINSEIAEIDVRTVNSTKFPTSSVLMNNVVAELYIGSDAAFRYSDVKEMAVQRSVEGNRQVLIYGVSGRLAGVTLPNKDELFGVYKVATGVYIALNEGERYDQNLTLSSKCSQLDSNPMIASFLHKDGVAKNEQAIKSLENEQQNIKESIKNQGEIRGESSPLYVTGTAYATISDNGELIYNKSTVGAGQRIRYASVQKDTIITVVLKNTAGFKTPIHASMYESIPEEGGSVQNIEGSMLVVKYLEIGEEYKFEYRCNHDGFFVIDGYNLEGTGISLSVSIQSVSSLTDAVQKNTEDVEQLSELSNISKDLVTHEKIELGYKGLSAVNIDESGLVFGATEGERCKYTHVNKNTKVIYTITNNASWEHIFRVSLYGNIPQIGDKPINGAVVKTIRVNAYETKSVEYDCFTDGYIAFFGYGAGDGTRPLEIEGYISSSIVDKVLDGGKVLWVGTSIPEGSTYPAMACMKIGAKCINKSVGSSSIRFMNEHPSTVTSSSGKHLTATVAEQEALYRQDVVAGKITEADLETIKGYSFERRIIPYIDGSNEDQIDVLVIDHGYNDRSNIHQMMANKDSIDWESRDRSNFVGAFNYLIDRVFSVKPNLKIVIAGYFQNTVVSSGSITYNAPEICEMQTLLAERNSFSIMKAWEHTQINGRFIAGTSNYFEEYNKKYGTNYTAKKTDENGNITSIQMYCPDEVHPHSDLSGMTNRRLDAVYAKLLRGCVDF